MIWFNEQLIRNYGNIDSFEAYMCLEGSFEIEFKGEKTLVEAGDTVLIPAVVEEVTLIPVEGEVRLLEVYVP